MIVCSNKNTPKTTLSKKIGFKGTVFFLVIISNYWILRILSLNIVVGMSVLATTLTVYIYINERKKSALILMCFFFFLTLFLQVITNKPYSLTELSNDQKRLQAERLSFYPPTRITFIDKTLWVPLGQWFEVRKESIIMSRISDNISEVIDPNLYFFKNHPRERFGVSEFRKYPFFLIVLFWIGFLELITNKEDRVLLILLCISVMTFGIIGTRNELGPFLLFPFICMLIYKGLIFILVNKKIL